MPPTRRARLALLVLALVLGSPAPSPGGAGWRDTLREAREDWEYGRTQEARRGLVAARDEARQRGDRLGLGHTSFYLGSFLSQRDPQGSCQAYQEAEAALSEILDRDRIQESWTGSPPSWLRQAVDTTPEDWVTYEAALWNRAQCLDGAEAESLRLLSRRLEAFRKGQPVPGTRGWFGTSRDLPEGRKLPEGALKLLTMPGNIGGLAFSPDGEYLAVSVGGTPETMGVRVIRVSTGEEVRNLSRVTPDCMALAFTPDGQDLLLASSSKLHRIPVPFLRGSGTIEDLPEPAATPRSLSRIRFTRTFDGAHRMVASSFTPVGTPPFLEIRPTRGGAALHLQVEAFDTVTDLATSPSGRYLAACGGEVQVSVWDQDLELKSLLETPELWDRGVRSVALTFLPDDTLVAAYSDGSFTHWDIDAERAPLASFRGPTQGAAQVIRSAPDGSQLFSGHLDGGLGLWEPRSGRHQGILRAHGAGIWKMAVSPLGNRLATGDMGGQVVLWSLPLRGTR